VTDDLVGPAERVMKILEANRQQIHPDVPEDLLAEIAEIQEQYQFDDDRNDPRRAIRSLVDRHARSMALKELQSR